MLVKRFEVMDRVGDKRERSPEALDEHSKRLRSAAAATEELMKFIENPRGQVFSAEYIMELIEGRGANPDIQVPVEGTTLLMVLSILGRNNIDGPLHAGVKKVFGFLVDGGRANINLVEYNRTALIHHVVCMRDPWFLRKLLSRGESRQQVNLFDPYGCCPLYIACNSPRVPIESIRLLLNNLAIPNLQHRDNSSVPLHCALSDCIALGNLERLTSILDAFFGAGVRVGNEQDRDGDTVMHVAARDLHDAVLCAKVLNNGGSQSLYVQNHRRFTPLQQAMRFGNADMERVIRVFMAGG